MLFGKIPGPNSGLTCGRRLNRAHLADKSLIVLTKPDCSIVFNQTIEVQHRKAKKMPFHVLLCE